MTELEQAFEARVTAAVAESHRLGYHPSDFEGMLRNAPAVRVAEKLVASGDLQSGLHRLASRSTPSATPSQPISLKAAPIFA